MGLVTKVPNDNQLFQLQLKTTDPKNLPVIPNPPVPKTAGHAHQFAGSENIGQGIEYIAFPERP